MLVSIKEFSDRPDVKGFFGSNNIRKKVKSGEIPSKCNGVRRYIILEKALEWLADPDVAGRKTGRR